MHKVTSGSEGFLQFTDGKDLKALLFGNILERGAFVLKKFFTELIKLHC